MAARSSGTYLKIMGFSEKFVRRHLFPPQMKQRCVRKGSMICLMRKNPAVAV